MKGRKLKPKVKEEKKIIKKIPTKNHRRGVKISSVQK